MANKPPVQALRADQYATAGVSDEQMLSIGRVIVRWSQLEAAIEDTIWLFLDLSDDLGRKVTNRLNTDHKIGLLRILGQRHIENGDLAQRFDNMMVVVDELRDARNFIAHGVWCTMMPEDIPIALSLKPKAGDGIVVSENFEPARMDAIVDGIERATGALIALPEQLGRPRRIPE